MFDLAQVFHFFATSTPLLFSSLQAFFSVRGMVASILAKNIEDTHPPPLKVCYLNTLSVVCSECSNISEYFGCLRWLKWQYLKCVVYNPSITVFFFCSGYRPVVLWWPYIRKYTRETRQGCICSRYLLQDTDFLDRRLLQSEWICRWVTVATLFIQVTSYYVIL